MGLCEELDLEPGSPECDLVRAGPNATEEQVRKVVTAAAAGAAAAYCAGQGAAVAAPACAWFADTVTGFLFDQVMGLFAGDGPDASTLQTRAIKAAIAAAWDPRMVGAPIVLGGRAHVFDAAPAPMYLLQLEGGETLLRARWLEESFWAKLARGAKAGDVVTYGYLGETVRLPVEDPPAGYGSPVSALAGARNLAAVGVLRALKTLSETLDQGGAPYENVIRVQLERLEEGQPDPEELEEIGLNVGYLLTVPPSERSPEERELVTQAAGRAMANASRYSTPLLVPLDEELEDEDDGAGIGIGGPLLLGLLGLGLALRKRA